ncbi:hypothetical protein GCM10010116_52490 [Microbispora rosea subsp. aerata]|nr:hypothetical protein GCM10010116_52490 [Microbispora rosea subsp. aerata]GIH58220.1 hypothetical protein Mro02_51340 [Microbispora rosea subsp. aerata]GLJ87006.1 hypothetical protein GCM10017588_57490 [Microbispora rosea subsp. aerata]
MSTLLLNRMTLYGTIRLCEAALLYFPAVQQTTATRVSGGKRPGAQGRQARAPKAARQSELHYSGGIT